MPVETPSLFSKVIQEHLELKRRNAGLDGDMPLSRYMVDDPFSNHPLFKSEEQARLEETMDGQSVGDMTMLLNGANEDTAEHEALTGEAALAPLAPAAPAPTFLSGMEPQPRRSEEPVTASTPALEPAAAVPAPAAEPAAAAPASETAAAPAPAAAPDPDGATSLAATAGLPIEEPGWGTSRDFDWGD